MISDHSQKSNKLAWALIIFCALVGIALSIYAILTWDQADVIVEWETASELDTVGFNLLRANNPAGPFVQINTDLIPANSDTLTGSQYSYKDTETQAGVIYFYMLEEIELTGQSNQHGPISVKAQNYAAIELVIGISLIIGAIFFVFWSYRSATIYRES